MPAPRKKQLWMTGGLDALAADGAQISQEQLDQRRAGRASADLATIIYTSGTTGRPKGCESAETAIAWSKAINGGPAGGPGPVLRLLHATMPGSASARRNTTSARLADGGDLRSRGDAVFAHGLSVSPAAPGPDPLPADVLD